MTTPGIPIDIAFHDGSIEVDLQRQTIYDTTSESDPLTVAARKALGPARRALQMLTQVRVDHPITSNLAIGVPLVALMDTVAELEDLSAGGPVPEPERSQFVDACHLEPGNVVLHWNGRATETRREVRQVTEEGTEVHVLFTDSDDDPVTYLVGEMVPAMIESLKLYQ
jgi:hypothetical protein